jgi:hypothetical protein
VFWYSTFIFLKRKFYQHILNKKNPSKTKQKTPPKNTQKTAKQTKKNKAKQNKIGKKQKSFMYSPYNITNTDTLLNELGSWIT